MMKKLLPILVFAALVVAGCTDTEKYHDPRFRDEALLKSGMIYYGEDPDEDGFNDMYFAFAAEENEMAEASTTALGEFKSKVGKLSSGARKDLGYIFNDLADLAELANYSYKDAEVELPDGWEDLGVQNPEIMNIFTKPTTSGLLPMGLKCSLMAKDERRVLVFAGTDFPASWGSMDQVLHFIADAYEDVYGALNKDASQVVMASKIVDELIAAGYVTKENLEFAGHSLGGRLASEMSVRYGCPAVVFNAAGVSPEVYQNYEMIKNAAGKDWRGYIVNVVSANDPLTCAQEYMSGQTDPIMTKVSQVLSADKTTVDAIVSIGLDVLGLVVDKVMGDTEVVATVKDLADEYAPVVDQLYERDYRAIGAMMPIRENMAGHGIKELALALRARAELCD